MDFYEMRGAYLRATQEDILHRIRFLGEALAANMNMANDCFDAADEIERLRAEVSRLMQIICDSSPDDDYLLVRQEADAIWERIYKDNEAVRGD